jgi:hypothetical protein
MAVLTKAGWRRDLERGCNVEQRKRKRKRECERRRQKDDGDDVEKWERVQL